MTRFGHLTIALLLATATAGATPGAELALPPDAGSPIEVVFRVNDAYVKDRMLSGVAIVLAREAGGEPVAAATTDAAGSARLRLAPGTYYASYELAGYVPLQGSETPITGDGQIVTTTLSMLLETEGRPAGERRVRLVLNWGSDQGRQVRDADSHLVCACGTAEPHVYYRAMAHAGALHAVNLDVDDTDWGGPETVTLTNPPPGDHVYWVHDFGNGPGTLGSSDVVVRLLVGDVVADELRVPGNAADPVWRPFRALRVRPDLGVELVPFTEAELTQGAQFVQPAGYDPEPPTPAPAPGQDDAEKPLLGGRTVLLIVAGLFVLRIVRRLARARRAPTDRSRR